MSTSSEHAELLILGSGPAGYAAAVHAARSDLRPLLVTDAELCAPASEAPHPWPTDIDVVPGTAMKRRLRDHAERASTRIVFDRIKAIHLMRRPFRLEGQTASYTCNALIVAVDRPMDTRMFNGQLDMRDGHIVTLTGLSGMATLTSLQGVFIAGDLQEPDLDQVITRTGTGCMAVLDAQRFLGL